MTQKLIALGERTVKQINKTFSQSYYDKRGFKDDVVENKPVDGKGKYLPVAISAIWNDKAGIEITRQRNSIRVDARYNETIIGYLTTKSNTFENPALMTTFVRVALYDANGFFVRSDNFQQKLPMFAAGWWSTYNNDWTLDGIIYRTGDGKEAFEKAIDDKDEETLKWLDKVLFYTCLEYYNKIRSLNGSDGRLYKNELCLDNNIDHSEYVNKQMKDLGNKTLAYDTLEKHEFFKNMNDEEKELLFIWNKILKNAKLTDNYNPDFNYGPFQIEQELNTFYYEEVGKTKKKVFNYPELNGDLKTLRVKIKEYYKKYIEEYLFKYEFLK